MDKLKRVRNYMAILLLLGMASCAKENLPAAEAELQSYGKLYFVQASLTGNINFRLYVDTDKRDTAFNLMNVTLGGMEPADHDVPVQFQVLDQSYVDAYNNQKSMSAKLLPQANYVLDKDVVIKRGTSTTGTLPIKIKLDGLSNGDVYILPVKFVSSDPAYEVDAQKQVAYYVFTCKLLPVGKYMGNIPQVTDPRARLFDFYDDLMLRDTAGNLWVYPLKGRETIGEPVKVATGFGNVISLFFNAGYNRLIGIVTDGLYANCIVSWTITNMPDVKIGDPFLAYKSTDYIDRFGNSFFPAENGVWYGTHYTPVPLATLFYGFIGLNASGTAAARNNIGSGFHRDVYKGMCTINNGVVANHPTGLLLYLMNPGGATFTSNRWQIGNGFWNYYHFISYKLRDLIAIRKNGDLIRYKNFDIYGFYTANE
ncbi:DUF1735 domain-containing protein [Niabella sp. CC-SYL272]|uniref:DUF1735 domain-containing protein n=1 Tax=Niabella agricola TaxID=2891571 RepID=UPI001F3F90E9|nr:DUF1735 domain-containing protein [Niabella agricola]MCF3108542.1 DUF1735 domain-containing protein [Niabella agricola]